MNEKQIQGAISHLGEGLFSEELGDNDFLEYGKFFSRALKDNKSKHSAVIFEALAKLASKPVLDEARYELLIHLLLLAKFRVEFDARNLQRQSYSNMSAESRSQVAGAVMSYISSFHLVCIAADVMRGLALEWGGKGDNYLLEFLNSQNFCKRKYRFVIALEEGLTSYAAAGEALTSAEVDQLDISKWDDDLEIYADTIRGSSPKSVFQFGVDENYLEKYWPLMALVARWATANKAIMVVNYVKFYSEPISDRAKKLLSIISEASAERKEGGVRIVLESVKEAHYTKPYFASSRFLAANSLVSEFNCPVFFPDVEVLPQKDLELFLSKLGGSKCVFGSNAGLKTIFPWRRWLASEFVMIGGEGDNDIASVLVMGFRHCLNLGAGWFVDQNIIHFLEKRCDIKGVQAIRTDKASIGLPLVQTSATKKM